MSRPDSDELLDRLVLDQLVQSAGDPDRFGMHSLVRALAADLLGEDHDGELTPALEEMFGWYARKLALFTHSGTPRVRVPAETRAWLDAEEANLVALLHASEQVGFDPYTTQVAFPVAAVARSRALWAEWKWAADLGRAAAARLGDRDQEALLLAELADYQMLRESDLDAAVASLTEAVRLTDPVRAPGLAARVHYRLAQLHREAGRDADVAQALAAAIAAAATSDDPAAGLMADQFRAETLVEHGEFDQAVELLAPMAPMWAELDVTIEVPMRLLLTKAYMGQRRHTAALDELKRCRQLCSDYGTRDWAPEVQWRLGLVNRALGFKGRAREAWANGLALFERAGYVFNAGMAGRLAIELGDAYAGSQADVAEELFGRAAEAFGWAEQYGNQTAALDRQAEARLSMGDHAGAAAAWEAGLAALDHVDDPAWAAKRQRVLRDKLRRAADVAP